jgi:hypothetical protein
MNKRALVSLKHLSPLLCGRSANKHRRILCSHFRYPYGAIRVTWRCKNHSTEVVIVIYLIFCWVFVFQAFGSLNVELFPGDYSASVANWRAFLVFWLAILVNRDTERCNTCVLIGYYLEYSPLTWVVDQSWFPFEMSSDLGSNGLSAVIVLSISPLAWYLQCMILTLMDLGFADRLLVWLYLAWIRCIYYAW